MRKGLPDLKCSLLDFMGKEELAGNLFRLTFTEGRILKDKARGQAQLQQIAHDVGQRVREAMIDETGRAPEDSPLSSDVKKREARIKSHPQRFCRLARQPGYGAEARSANPFNVPRRWVGRSARLPRVRGV